MAEEKDNHQQEKNQWQEANNTIKKLKKVWFWLILFSITHLNNK